MTEILMKEKFDEFTLFPSIDKFNFYETLGVVSFSHHTQMEALIRKNLTN